MVVTTAYWCQAISFSADRVDYLLHGTAAANIDLVDHLVDRSSMFDIHPARTSQLHSRNGPVPSLFFAV
jgi:hypothetical protein